MIIQQNDPQASSKTLIHVLPTTERAQQRVLSLLRRLVGAAFVPQRGFRGTLAQSIDRKRIVMQSEWAEPGDFRRALRTPVGTEYWLRVRALLAGGDVCGAGVDVYEDLVSFYSLGAKTGHGAPFARATSIAGTVS